MNVGQVWLEQKFGQRFRGKVGEILGLEGGPLGLEG